MGSFDKSRFHQVEAEERRFICPRCNKGATYILYPSEHPTDGAISINCDDCNHLYWRSRKQSKLFDNDTKEEVDPQNIMLIGKVIALQLGSTPEE